MRNGRSFCTRRVTARQSVGVILEMTASYQVDEDGPTCPDRADAPRPPPGELTDDSWSPIFERRFVPAPARGGVVDAGGGRHRRRAGLHACGLAYLSDDLPTDAVVSLHPGRTRPARSTARCSSASLDHAIYFHRPLAADRLAAPDVHVPRADELAGVSVGYVFAEDGTHVATIVQEVLVRKVRRRRLTRRPSLAARCGTPRPAARCARA